MKLTEKALLTEISRQRYPTATSVSRALGLNSALVWAFIENMAQRQKIRKHVAGRSVILEVVQQ